MFEHSPEEVALDRHDRPDPLRRRAPSPLRRLVRPACWLSSVLAATAADLGLLFPEPQDAPSESAA